MSTSAGDVILATDSPLSTLNAGDNITGVGGVLKIVTSGTAAVNFLGWQSKGIATVAVTADNTVGTTVDGSLAAGVTTLSSVNSLHNLTFNAFGTSATTLAVNNTTNLGGGSTVALTGSGAATQGISLSNAGTSATSLLNVSTAVATTDAITAAAGANFVKISDSSAGTLASITAAGAVGTSLALTADVSDAKLLTYDASALQGNEAVNLAAVTHLVTTIMGGAGNDAVNLGSHLGTGQAIDLGAGANSLEFTGQGGTLTGLTIANVGTLIVDDNLGNRSQPRPG